MVEQEYSLGEEIRWKKLGNFIAKCNQVLGRNAVVTVGSDGLISAIDLTAQELETIKAVNRRFDVLDSWEPSKLRNLTLTQAEAKIDAITDLASAKAVLKTMARIIMWLLKREMQEI